MLMERPLALAIAFLAAVVPRIAPGSELPPLPRLGPANSFPAIRQQILEAYSQARAHPGEAAASGKLGMVLDTYEQYADAAACYERARALEPNSFQWLYYLGWVQSAAGRYREAVQTLNQALQVNPDYLSAQLKLAEALAARGDWEESGEVYQAILARRPDCAQACYGAGRVRAARGDTPGAAELLGRACALFPAYGAAHYLLALAYRKLGNAAASREHFALYERNVTAVPPLEDPLRQAVLELNRGANRHIERGIALEQAGMLREAIAEHEAALAISPNQVQAHVNLISLYGRTGQPEKGEEHYRAAIKLNPNAADAHYDYGVLLFRKHEYAEAEQAFRRALAINPFHADAHHNLGYLYEQQGRLEEALQEYQEAVKDQPDYRLAHFHIGRILVNQNKYQEAIQHFLKTLTPEDEATPGYLYALGATYGRAGDGARALDYLHKARDEATARGQTALLPGIDRDIRTVEQEQRHP
ncbi:MAG: hypothetical protein DMG24_18005 [Acidobacteria bacterium]|nr:MAG: hypothetical protein DMG24_18005 [Acidobacteriota bacterium]